MAVTITSAGAGKSAPATQSPEAVAPKAKAKKRRKSPHKPLNAPARAPGLPAFRRIYELPEEQQVALNNMFYEGQPVGKIIQVLHEGWGAFKDVKAQSLQKYLYRYKWEVIDKNLVMRQQEPASAHTQRVVAKVKGQIDVLEEIAQLVVTQKTRVQKLLVRENSMPMLFNSLGGEMKTLAGFIGQYADMAFDVGLMTRVPKLTKITNSHGDVTTVESEGKDHVAFHVENSKQLEDAASEFFRVLEGEVTDAELAEE